MSIFNALCEGLKRDITVFYHNYSPYTPDDEIDFTYYNMKEIRKDLNDPDLIDQIDDILNTFSEMEKAGYINLPE